VSLDVFRGLTIIAMILVNNPGSRVERYGPLAHAEWDGCTPTDLIFPFFLFIVGTSTAFSLRKHIGAGHASMHIYLRIARRTFVLFALGVFLNFFGDFLDFAYGHLDAVAIDNLRLLGVLQRIALVYCAVSLIVLHLSVRHQLLLAATVLLGYWTLLSCLPNPYDQSTNLSPEGNVVRIVDRALLGNSHLFTHGQHKPTDPEGLVSTLPAIVTSLIGYWTGLFLLRKGANLATIGWFVGIGVSCIIIGLSWDSILPINKRLWTSSFVMLSGGLAMIAFAACCWTFDVSNLASWRHPFEVVGRNAIFAYVASHMLGQYLSKATIGMMSLREWLFESTVTPWLTDGRLASLVFAVAVVVIFWLVLWAMSRRGWTPHV
jgi:predicted acyltransferase